VPVTKLRYRTASQTHHQDVLRFLIEQQEPHHAAGVLARQRSRIIETHRALHTIVGEQEMTLRSTLQNERSFALRTRALFPIRRGDEFSNGARAEQPGTFDLAMITLLGH
jgi:hypothetical protein